MARKKKHPEHANHERWLVSYADFITLLFAFFVVMFATSASKPEKVKQFVGSVRDAFSSYGVYVGISEARVIGPPDAAGSPKITIEVADKPTGLSGIMKSGTKTVDDGEKEYQAMTDKEPTEEDANREEDAIASPTPEASATPEEEATPTPEPTAAPSPGPGGGQDMNQVYQDLKSVLATELADQQIEIKQEKRGIVISLREAGFFDSGSADVKPKSVEIINRIASKLDSLANPFLIRVEGHTDNQALHNTSRFRDNWELSSARANGVIHYLMERHGYSPQKLIASGYAEWHPIASNDTPEGRARNRRVDIVILNEESASQEPSLANVK